jgi:hypothetical protein
MARRRPRQRPLQTMVVGMEERAAGCMSKPKRRASFN